MKKRGRKKGLLVACSALATACFALGGAIGSEKSASAENAADILSAVRLSMTQGASVRLSGTSESGANSGIRFGMTLSNEDYEMLNDNVGSGKALESVSFGMLIAPIGYRLTEENCFGEQAIYDWATFDESSSSWHYINGGKRRIVNIEGGLEHWTDYTTDDGTVKLYTGSVINIKAQNLTNEFHGVGYLAATVGGETQYLFAEENDNVRSIVYTAQKCLETEISSEDRTFLENNYLNPVAEQTTNYTLEIYDEGQNGVLQKTSSETKSAKIGSSVSMQADGNKPFLSAQSNMQSVVYANGKTVLRACYAYKPTGAFDYRILLSTTPTETEEFAAEELQFYYQKATGVTLPIVQSDTLNANGYYISIGDTALQTQNAFANLSAQGTSGYAIRSLGNSYLLDSYGEDGKVYAAYGFMEEAFGLEIYDEDAYAFLKTPTALPSSLNVAQKPAFLYRSVAAYPIDTSASRAWRLRFNGSVAEADGVGDVNRFSLALNSHSFFKLLPIATYYEPHKDWYYLVDGEIRQICLYQLLNNSNMYSIVLENMKSYILAEPNAYYFMFGFEDFGTTHCKCSNCQSYENGDSEYFKYLYIDATNRLAVDVYAWLRAENSSRAEQVKIGMFAYNDMAFAPAKTRKLSSHAYLYFAPIGIQHEYAATESVTGYNERIKNTIEPWKNVADCIMVWNYSSAFKDYVAPFNDIESTKSWMQVFENMGAIRMMTQGARETGMTSFDAFRYYVNSKLMWNTSCDFATLKSNFFATYYSGVSNEMTAYYDKLVAKLNNLKGTVSTGTVQKSIYSAAYFSQAELKDYLSDLKSILNKTKANQTVYGRVLKETMFVRCALLEFYSSAYTTKAFVDELTALEDDAKRCGFTYAYEGWYNYESSLSYKFNAWKEQAAVKAELLSRKVTSTENYADATNLNYWTVEGGTLSSNMTGVNAWAVKFGYGANAKLTFSKEILKKAAMQGYTTVTYTAIADEFNFWLEVYGGKDGASNLLPTDYEGRGEKGGTITQVLNLADLWDSETGEYTLTFSTIGWWGGTSMYLSALTFGGNDEEENASGKEYWDGQKDFFGSSTLPGGKEYWNGQKDFF